MFQLRAYPATRVVVLDGLVLVQHAHDATVMLGSEMHEALHDILGNDTIVDVVDEVADTIKDYQVGVAIAYRHFESGQTLIHRLLADIEDIELIAGKLILLDACHLTDTLAEDVLGGLVALLGIIPEDVQLTGLDPLYGEHFVAKAQRHQYATDKCLAAFGLT